MPSPKQERANAIVTHILNEDKVRPQVDPRSALPTRMVGEPNGLSATLTLGYRFNVAPVYGETRTGRRPIADAKWFAISIKQRGNEVFAANVLGSTVHIAFYMPGAWECVYGVDWEGDDLRFQWGDPPIGDDIEGQIRLRKKDFELDPLRAPPPAVDQLRTSVMRPGRARQPQPRPSGPLTVSLQRRAHATAKFRR